MIPSLKETYQDHLRQRLEELKKNPHLLKEEIDKETLTKMEKALQKLDNLFKMPEFKGLDSFHLGLRKGYQDLKKILGYGDIMSWAHHLIPKGLTAIGRLNKFESGVIRVLQKLPKIIEIVKGGESDWRKGEWDPNKPIEALVSDETQAELKKIILNAMQRGEGTVFGDKLPYIDNDEAASELLMLSFNQMMKLSQAVSRSPVLDQAQAEAPQIARDAAAGSESGEVATDPEAKRVTSKQPTASLLPPKPESQPKKTPIQASLGTKKALEDVYKMSERIAKGIYPTRPDGTVKLDKNVETFRDEFINNLVKWMIEQGFVGKPPTK